MKKLALLLVTIFIIGTATAQTKFETGTLSQALKKAKTNKKGPKMVFLDCYTSWCGPCKVMARDVFPLPEVGEYLNANFVNIKLDMEKGEGPALAKKYQIKGYPTFLILDGDGNEITRVVGGNYPQPFLKSVKYAIDPKKQPSYLKAEYEKKKSLETGLNYLEILTASKDQSALLEDMYFSLDDKERFSTTMIDLLFKNFKGFSDPALADICAKKYLVDRYYGSNFTTKKLKDYLTMRLSGYCTSEKKLHTDEEIKQGAMLLGLLAPEQRDLSAHVGNLALLYSKNDNDGIVSYFRKYLSLVPNENRTVINRMMVNIAMDPNSTPEQKASIKEYFRLSASTTKTLLESINKRIEEVK